MTDLPQGWVSTKLDTIILNIVGGGTPSKSNPGYFSGDIPFMTVKDMKTFHPPNTQDKISQIALRNSSAKLIPANTLIIATRMGLGKICSVSFDTAINQDLKALFPSNEISKDFLFYWMRSQARTIENLGKGTTVKGIRLENLKALSINLPPLAEQERIAQKLHGIIAEINRAQSHLDKIPAILKSFRQEIINKYIGAVHSDKNVKTVSLQSVCDSISDGDHQAPPQTDHGIPFLVISNITKGYLDLQGATRFVPKTYYHQLKEVRTPRKGDILYSVTGSIGVSVVVEIDAQFCFQRHIAILKPIPKLVLSRFLHYYLRSSYIQRQAMDIATGTAQITLPLQALRNFQLKIPSLSIQKNVVDILESSLEAANHVEQRYKKSAENMNKIAQSVFLKAFRGELVPQNPKDEPASVLLERIKAEKSFVSLKSIRKKRALPSDIMENRKMISPVELTLKKENMPLSAQELFDKSGYPKDADAEKLEAFFLDIRDSLATGVIGRKRVGNEDIFHLVA